MSRALMPGDRCNGRRAQPTRGRAEREFHTRASQRCAKNSPCALDSGFSLHLATARLPSLAKAGSSIPGGGPETSALRHHSIRSDERFNSFVLSGFRAGEGVVVDPVLAPSGQPLAGFVVADLEAMVQDEPRRQSGR